MERAPDYPSDDIQILTMKSVGYKVDVTRCDIDMGVDSRDLLGKEYPLYRKSTPRKHL